MIASEEWARRNARYEAMKRVLIIITACLVTASFGFLIYLSSQSAQTTKAIRDTQKNNHVLLNTIDDCTKPSGECYQRGQARTASAVSSINRVVVLAAACSVGLSPALTVVQRQAAIQGCVISRLAHKP